MYPRNTADVICAAWNSRHTKLTTSDTAGLIIVWMLYRGMMPSNDSLSAGMTSYATSSTSV